MYCFRENSNFPFSNQKIITLDQDAGFDFSSAASLRQQSIGRLDMLLYSNTSSWIQANHAACLYVYAEKVLMCTLDFYFQA
jgi:hypothetical protein